MVLGVAGSSPVSHPLNVQGVLEQYGLPRPQTVTPVGGTASANVRIDTPAGAFILRRRPAGMAHRGFVEYDHALKASLADRGFPAAKPIAGLTGQTWVEADGQFYELSRVLPGKVVAVPNTRQLFDAGRTLARFHQLTQSFSHPGKQDFVREDHVSILQPLLDDLARLPMTADQREQLGILQGRLKTLAALAADGFFSAASQTVIHGDFHPGNLLFDGPTVSGLLDFDYTSHGPILRDIGDGLMFLTARREEGFDPDDIWSLTRAWQPDTERALPFLDGYTAVCPLPEDWPLANYILLSRWLQIRLRGSRKVPPERKLEFVLTDMEPTARWLEQRFLSWLIDLMMKL